jgi:hypothetical protein
VKQVRIIPVTKGMGVTEVPVPKGFEQKNNNKNKKRYLQLVEL